jgi:hypothetical protein
MEQNHAIDLFVKKIKGKKYTLAQKKTLARMALAKAKYGVGYSQDIETLLNDVTKAIKH